MATGPAGAPGSLSWSKPPPEAPGSPRDYDLWAGLITAIGDTRSIEFAVRKKGGRPVCIDTAIEVRLELDEWIRVAEKARRIQAERLEAGEVEEADALGNGAVVEG